MYEQENKLSPAAASWIISLAISVACCAVLFVVFAGYLSDIKKTLVATNEQLQQMAARDEALMAQLKLMRTMVAHEASPTAAPAAVGMPEPSATEGADMMMPTVAPDNVPAPAPAVEAPVTGVPALPNVVRGTGSAPTATSAPTVSVPVQAPQK